MKKSKLRKISDGVIRITGYVLWWIFPWNSLTSFMVNSMTSTSRLYRLFLGQIFLWGNVNSSGIDTCTKSPRGDDGGPSEDQVNTRNICVKNDINGDIKELIWMYRKEVEEEDLKARRRELSLSSPFSLLLYHLIFSLPHATWEG